MLIEKSAAKIGKISLCSKLFSLKSVNLPHFFKLRNAIHIP